MRFLTADVFTDRVFGGNPLAVFPDGRGLSDRRMQEIARELNLAETVFVLPPADPSPARRLRIFTPGMELPFAGHPTVGTAIVLAAIGEIALAESRTSIVFEEGVGPVPVTIDAVNGTPTHAQLTVARLPEIGPASPSPSVLAALLSLGADDLAPPAWPARMMSAGVPFLCIPLRDRDALRRARLDHGRWAADIAHLWAPHVYPFTRDAEGEGVSIRARMFSPAMGIPEDPATGAAAAALAGYLAIHDWPAGSGTSRRWLIEQGIEMGRPSLIAVEADCAPGGALTAVRVGGGAVLVSEGTMKIPD